MDEQVILGNNGSHFTIEYDGKKYLVRYRTQQVKAEFVKWAKQRKIDEWLSYEGKLPDDKFWKMHKDLSAAFDSADPKVNYSFDGANCVALRQTQEGALYYLRLLISNEDGTPLKMSDVEFEDLVTDNSLQLQAYIAACNARMEKIKEELGWDSTKDPEGKTVDPKKYRQALKTAGLW